MRKITLTLMLAVTLGASGCLPAADVQRLDALAAQVQAALKAHEEGKLTTTELVTLANNAQKEIEDIRSRDNPWWEIGGTVLAVVALRLLGVPGLAPSSGSSILGLISRKVKGAT